MSPLIIATIGKKGGIGKTTLTFHLAGLLGDMGVRVLLVEHRPERIAVQHLRVARRGRPMASRR